LVGREDLASTHLSWSGGHRTVPRSGDAVSPNTHVDDVWMAAPYMLHLRPVPSLAISSDGSELRDLVVQVCTFCGSMYASFWNVSKVSILNMLVHGLALQTG